MLSFVVGNPCGASPETSGLPAHTGRLPPPCGVRRNGQLHPTGLGRELDHSADQRGARHRGPARRPRRAPRTAPRPASSGRGSQGRRAALASTMRSTDPPVPAPRLVARNIEDSWNRGQVRPNDRSAAGARRRGGRGPMRVGRPASRWPTSSDGRPGASNVVSWPMAIRPHRGLPDRGPERWTAPQSARERDSNGRGSGHAQSIGQGRSRRTAQRRRSVPRVYSGPVVHRQLRLWTPA